MKHIVIIGGGIIGLSCALELLKRGHKVTVLEKGTCGGQASGAAAGMLAPYSENGEGLDPFFDLCHAGLQAYPEWINALREVTDLPFEYVNSGSLHAAFHEADLLHLENRLAWQQKRGIEAEIADGQRLAKMEPALTKTAYAAIYYPQESHLYAPDYVKALQVACKALGATIQEHVASISISEWQNGIALALPSGMIEADDMVLCTGAWTQEWEALFGLKLPVQPIRGQICSFDHPPASFRHMVFGNQGYLVQKGNGSIVCGASEDIAGFNTAVTDRGIGRLLRWAGKLCPQLGGIAPSHAWAGLRPATPDGRPFIGALSSSKHVIIAAGHYRNGILLSPITALVAADIIDSIQPAIELSPFAPERFGQLMPSFI